MDSKNPDSQMIPDVGWIDELIDAAQEYGGSRGVDLEASIRTPDRWLPDFSGSTFDLLDGGEVT